MFSSTCEKEMSAIVVLFCVLFIHSGITEEEIGSPLRVAQCRARCIQRFIAEADYEKGCPQGSDCSMCWENCQLLQSNFPVWWRTICDERRICFPGCEEACQFHDEIGGSQREPVVQTRGEEVVELFKDGLANWPRPSRASAPFVYVVMRRLGEKPWRQISQGLRPRARVPEGGLVRVLVVNRDGLVAIYSPKTSSSTPLAGSGGSATGRISPELATAKYILQSVGRSDILAGYPVPQLPPSGKRINTQIFLPSTSVPNSILEDSRNERKRPSRKRPWNLHEVSLIHQKYLVIAEIAWEPRQQQQIESPLSTGGIRKPFYFVTWEVDGGGLKGNLLTESTTVTLSLCTDTVYHIQVEVAVRLGEVDEWSEKSEEIVVDTGRAVVVELDAASAAAAAAASNAGDASLWNQQQQQQQQQQQRRRQQQDLGAIVRVPAWPFTTDKAQFLGAVAAASLFLALTLVIVFIRSRWRHSLQNNDEPKLLPPSPPSRPQSLASGSFSSLVRVVEESDLTNHQQQQQRRHHNHHVLPHPHHYPRQHSSCTSNPSTSSSESIPSCSSASILSRNSTLHV